MCSSHSSSEHTGTDEESTDNYCVGLVHFHNGIMGIMEIVPGTHWLIHKRIILTLVKTVVILKPRCAFSRFWFFSLMLLNSPFTAAVSSRSRRRTERRPHDLFACFIVAQTFCWACLKFRYRHKCLFFNLRNPISVLCSYSCVRWILQHNLLSSFPFRKFGAASLFPCFVISSILISLSVNHFLII